MLHQRVTPRALGFVRFWVFALWLATLIPDPFYQLAELPLSIFVPMGILKALPASFWPWFMNADALIGFKVILLLLVTLSMLGVRPYRPIALLTAVLLTLHQGFVRGFGFNNHGEYAILYAAYVLAVFPAADGFTLRRRPAEREPAPVYAGALLLIAALPLTAYAAIAAYRFSHGGIDLFMRDSMKHFITFHTFNRWNNGFRVGRLLLEWPALALLFKIGFPIISLFELSSPLCLVYRRFRYLWLAVMFPFHISTWFFMNIFFWQNLLFYSVVLIDIDRFVNPAPGSPAPRWAGWTRRLKSVRRAGKLSHP